MRITSKSLKNTLITNKKNSNNTPSFTNTEERSQMNNTSLSSLSTSSLKNQDKLIILKQKLQKQREKIQKTGKRFKDNSATSTQIQIQTQQIQQIKPITSKPVNKSNKTAIVVESTTASSLYDFQSIKVQVQNKTKGAFIKRNEKTKNNMIVPVYTTNQILNSVKNSNYSQASLHKQSQQQKILLKKQLINLTELSSVFQKSPTKFQSNKSKQKLKISQNQQQIKFFDLSKVKKQSNQNQEILSNSKVFQTAIKQQKQRNKEIQSFLTKIGLQQFTQKFINLGFDEVQTLIEVQVDDLNQIMMRAKQQDKLMKFIKQFKIKNNLKQTQTQNIPLVDRPILIKSCLGQRPKSAALTTQPSETNQTVQISHLRSIQNINMQQSTLMNKSSIFYLMGGAQWFIQTQIRKACSECFKINYDGIKRGDYYYCENCDPEKIQLQVSLDESMVRNYY